MWLGFGALCFGGSLFLICRLACVSLSLCKDVSAKAKVSGLHFTLRNITLADVTCPTILYAPRTTAQSSSNMLSLVTAMAYFALCGAAKVGSLKWEKCKIVNYFRPSFPACSFTPIGLSWILQSILSPLHVIAPSLSLFLSLSIIHSLSPTPAPVS